MLSSRVSQRIQAVSQCRGICTGSVSRESYSEAVEGARDFLNGKNKKLLDRLKSLMDEAAEKMEYEEAAVYRDYIEAAKALSATQRVVIQHSCFSSGTESWWGGNRMRWKRLSKRIAVN